MVVKTEGEAGKASQKLDLRGQEEFSCSYEESHHCRQSQMG